MFVTHDRFILRDGLGGRVEQMLATVMSSLGFRLSTAGWLEGIDFSLAAPQFNGNNVSTVIWAH